MSTLLHVWNLITGDAVTLAASGVLALAILALLVLIAWPARTDVAAPTQVSRPARSQHTPRSVQARALVASGSPAAEVARRTGLSRDALAILSRPMTGPARQKTPEAARLSWFKRVRGTPASSRVASQVSAA